MLLHFKDAAKCAELRFPRSENDTADPRLVNCPKAHQAGFKGDVYLSRIQAEVTYMAGGFAHGHQLGMCGNGCVHPRAVMPPSDHFPAMHDNRPDRHLACRKGKPGLFECEFHEFLIAGPVRV